MRASFAPRFVTTRWLSALVGGLLVCGLGFTPSAFAGSTPTVDLGQAAGYAVISGASVANTGTSTIRGDVGAPATPSGLDPPSVVDGAIQVHPDDTTAYNDFLAAYTEVRSRTGGTPFATLDGATLTPGLHTAAAAVAVTAGLDVTLDAGGDASAVFVIQVNGAFSLGAGSKVKLIGDAQAANVFWQINGAFSTGANAVFAGTALASTTGTVGAGSVVNGRVLAETAVTIDSSQFYSAPPTMTLTGGAAAEINDASPTISGTTNVGAAGTVTVTIPGQPPLTATPADDGSWSVNPTILANGTYPVIASTVDGAGNVGSATQQLTIDTVPPLITLDGAPSVVTDNPTAPISGTTDAVPGTPVTVDVEAQTLSAVVNGTTIVESVGAQTLTAVVQSNGTWNVAPGTPLGLGVRTVTASVTDPAGNTSTATEQLTVDALTPVTPAPGAPTPPITTAPITTQPITTPPAKAPPTSTPAPKAPKQVSLSSRTLTAQHPITVGFTLARPGTVQLTLVEVVHGKAKVIGTVTIKDRKAGKGSYTLTQRFAGHELGKGSYRLSLQTTIGKHHSKAVTQKVSVR